MRICGPLALEQKARQDQKGGKYDGRVLDESVQGSRPAYSMRDIHVYLGRHWRAWLSMLRRPRVAHSHGAALTRVQIGRQRMVEIRPMGFQVDTA